MSDSFVDEVDAAINQAVNGAKTQYIFPGTVSTATPLTVIFDGASLAVPCKKLASVSISDSARVVIVKVGSDFVVIGTFSNVSQGLAADVGGSVSVQITHNFGTRDLLINVYRNSTPYDQPICDILHTDLNYINIGFDSAPAAAAFRVVIKPL